MMKKAASLATTLLFLSFIVYGQPHDRHLLEDFNVHKFRIIKINLLPAQEHVSLRNVSLLTVVDARPDTVPVGFMQRHPLNLIFVELNRSVREETEEFANNYFQLKKNDSSGVILMVLKKLWLTDELNIAGSGYANEKVKDWKRLYTSGIKLKVEFYYKQQDGYYPLYRYDSVLTDSFTVTQNGQLYVHDAIIASLSKLITLDRKLGDIKNRRKLTWDEIKRHNEDSYDLPVLKDTSLRRGVYATFEEFKNNKPSIKDFEVRNDKKTDVLYFREPDGKEFIKMDIWGYCDGHKIFILSADNFFELQRMGNALYIYGSKTINRKHYKLILEPLQLDWDTGKLE